MYNVTTADAIAGRAKVEVIAEAVRRAGLGTEIVPIAADLRSPQAVKAAAECDILFGCMDSAYGRDLLSRLAAFYVLPYIDLGVQITAGERGSVRQIMGAVHYLQPGRSSLKSRRVYDSEDVRAELLSRDDPESYKRLWAVKYIKGVAEQRPAVISVNTQVSAMAVNELLARVHRFRFETNGEFAVQWLALHEGRVFSEPENKQEPCQVLRKHVGRGDVVPLLDSPELTVLAAQCVG